MAHHNSTPQTILDAPRFTPDPIYITTVIDTRGKVPVVRQVRAAFVGDVERDLLRVAVGTSRKGRKVRRAVSA